MSNKYDTSTVKGLASGYEISEVAFYNHQVYEEAVRFISEKEDVVKSLLLSNDEFDRGSDEIDGYYHEELRGQVTGTTHASFIGEVSSNYDDDEIKENGVVYAAGLAFATDVFERAKDMFADIKEEFDNINDTIDGVIKGFKEDGVEFNADDAMHIVAANALKEFLDLEGSEVEVIQAFVESGTELKEVYSEFMTLSADYAAELAINSNIDRLKAQLYPEPTVPGSIEEAAVIAHYLSEKQESDSFLAGGPLGSKYVDTRADPDIATRIFVEYTDTLAARALSSYHPPVKDVDRHDEAKALKKTPYASSEVVSAFIEKHFEGSGSGASFRQFGQALENAYNEAQVGKMTAEQLRSVAETRNLHGASSGELERYFALMHPEVARTLKIRDELDQSQMATLLAGLMDGSPAAKAKLVELKETVRDTVPEISKALVAFRKELYPEQELSGPSPR